MFVKKREESGEGRRSSLSCFVSGFLTSFCNCLLSLLNLCPVLMFVYLFFHIVFT